MNPEILSVNAVICTAVYMLADSRDHQPGKRFFKLAAATSFVAVAIVNGALDSDYGRALTVALVLSWLGDAALLSRAPTMFLGGLFAFLLGHVSYVVAFLLRGVDVYWAIAGGVLLGGVLATAGRWFVGKAPQKMRVAVAAYVAVIAAMVSLAIGAAPTPGGVLIAVAAVAFAVSDVFVGLDRFVRPGWETRRWGIPLYFGGQLAFAWTVA